MLIRCHKTSAQLMAAADAAPAPQSLEGKGWPSKEQLSSACAHGLIEVLASLVSNQAEEQLQSVYIKAFWDQLLACQKQQHSSVSAALQPALMGLAAAVRQQQQHLSLFAQQSLLCLIQQSRDQWQQQQQQQAAPGASPSTRTDEQRQQQQQAEQHAPQSVLQQLPANVISILAGLCHRHRTAVMSALMAVAPFSLPGVLQEYYQLKLQQLSDVIQQQQDELATAAAAAEEGPGIQQQQSDTDQSSDAMSEDDPRQTQREATTPQSPDPLGILGPDWTSHVSSVASCLEELGLSAASEEAYTRVINSFVLQQLRCLATNEYDEGVLPNAQRLVCAGPLAFLRLVLPGGQGAELQLQEWQLRLTYLMLETLGALRSSDMFDIVIDYPDSAPALQDLALCLQHTNMAGQFAASFKAALQQRLLHAGAATADIIHTYVSTIRAMRQIDPSGLLLYIVSEPIRAYLRSRPDTIRSIVSMLTGDGPDAAEGAGSSLLEELQEQQLRGDGAMAGDNFAAAAAGGAAGAGLAGGMPAGAAAALAGMAAVEPGKRVRYNWCMSETEGDEAALRLLEALEAAPDATSHEAAEQAALLGLPVQSAANAMPINSFAPGMSGRMNADVVSMLIGIYGGPLLFMEEYRTMLADRLLAKDEYDCEREICTLELLKIRFGDAGLHPCEVMLKDLADSKRLDTNVRALPGQLHTQQLPEGTAAALLRLRATICSYLFWPELQEHKLKLPADLQTALEVYAERFQHLKAPRKLLWRPTMGLVELAVTVGDSEPIDFRVTPVHAALLLQFADNSPAAQAAAAADDAGSLAGISLQQQQQGGQLFRVSLTAAQLSAAMDVPVTVVRRKAMFWVAAGVLLERRSAAGEVIYKRASSIEPSRIVSHEVTDISWKDDAGTTSSAADRAIAEMAPFENYIIGLLTNCGTLSLGRLHNMLRVFVVGEPKYEGRTQEQLAAFLHIMLSQNKLEMNNGLYSRPKAATA